jgi:hypothetical protein
MRNISYSKLFLVSEHAMTDGGFVVMLMGPRPRQPRSPMSRGELWPRYRHRGAEVGSVSNGMNGANGEVSTCRPKLRPRLADAANVTIEQHGLRSLHYRRRSTQRTTGAESVDMRSSLRLALERSLNEPDAAFLFMGDAAEAPSQPAQLAHFSALRNPFFRRPMHMPARRHLCSAEEATTAMNALPGTPPSLPLPPTPYTQTPRSTITTNNKAKYKQKMTKVYSNLLNTLLVEAHAGGSRQI